MFHSHIKQKPQCNRHKDFVWLLHSELETQPLQAETRWQQNTGEVKRQNLRQTGGFM
jgi:hypothetical protein